ncbi:dirigent protein 8-like [Lolium perenne]|uniref:dirigent protein 8-like n=1 Tax=Lolium perenne TaxID=4522 RepID=UPI0021F553F9|nr:uncharacterized protein LOC127338936 [Lolium perenne]
MATPSFALSLLLLFLAMPYPSLSCPATPCECELNLQLYLHQIVQGQPNHNQIVVTGPPVPEPAGFGTLVVIDWTVIDAIQPNATIVARAKGMAVQASIGVSGSWFNYFSLVFENARFSGSTLEVMGNFYDPKDGQMAIMGGTGELVSAHGVIKYKKVQETIGLDTYRQFNISAFYAPSTGYTCGAALL